LGGFRSGAVAAEADRPEGSLANSPAPAVPTVCKKFLRFIALLFHRIEPRQKPPRPVRTGLIARARKAANARALNRAEGPAGNSHARQGVVLDYK